MVDRRPPIACLGVSETGTKRRSGGPCRVHGDSRRIDPLPSHLLGLEGLHLDRPSALAPRVSVRSAAVKVAPDELSARLDEAVQNPCCRASIAARDVS